MSGYLNSVCRNTSGLSFWLYVKLTDVSETWWAKLWKRPTTAYSVLFALLWDTEVMAQWLRLCHDAERLFSFQPSFSFVFAVGSLLSFLSLKGVGFIHEHSSAHVASLAFPVILSSVYLPVLISLCSQSQRGFSPTNPCLTKFCCFCLKFRLALNSRGSRY